MTTTRLAAAVSGIAAIALGVVTMSGPTVPDEHWGTRGAVVNALGIVTFLALSAAVGLLPAALRLAMVGIAGTWAARVGLVLMTVESVASQVHGGNTWGPVFVVGLLLTVVGFLVVAVDGLRRPGARWLALLPLVALVVGIGAGDRGGFVLLGAAWCVLAAGSPTVRRDGARAAGGELISRP